LEAIRAHDYSTGLMFVTTNGNEPMRRSVLQLADWVLQMDDGRLTPFGWLTHADTGLASSTTSPLYHGPGRGAANSITTLLNAHRLTRDRRYLTKAEQLIKRCIHPSDDIDARNLLDAERRWSYTVFLQTLGKYLDEKQSLDSRQQYGSAGAITPARWMARPEPALLDKPLILSSRQKHGPLGQKEERGLFVWVHTVFEANDSGTK
jgi:hypothetical protein